MHAAIATKDLIMFMVGLRVVCNRQDGEKDKLMLRGSNINVFNFESKIYEIENEDEEVVNSNGPIFHFIFKDVHRSSHFFHFTFKLSEVKFWG